MEYKIFNKTVVLRLDKGDEIISCIKELCEKEKIKLASVSGIGGTDNFTVGIFNVKNKAYDKKTFTGTHEITSITGNINTMEDEHYSHIHITCAKKGGKAVGGHLINCYISLTAEIFINVIDGKVDRKKDLELNINKFSF